MKMATDRNKYAALLMPMLVLLVVAYLIPLAGVVLISFTEPKPGLGNYQQILNSAAMGRVALTTLRVCILTTAASVGIGYLLAYAFVRSSGIFRSAIFICVLVPLWTPVLIRTFSWLLILGEQGPLNAALLWSGIADKPLSLMHSETGVVIGMVHYMLPYAMLTISAGMQGIDERIAMAARGLGAGPVLTFIRIYFPLTLPGVIAATVLVFVLSLGFYSSPIVLGGGRVVLISEYISTQILQVSRWGFGTALASLLVVLVLLTLALAARTIDLRRMFPK
jgi:putative spermidine/putrescine transport system permease protein